MLEMIMSVAWYEWLILVVSSFVFCYGVVTVKHRIDARADLKYSHFLEVSPHHSSITRLETDNGISWDLAFFLLGITPGYEHNNVRVTVDPERSTKSKSRVTFATDAVGGMTTDAIERKLPSLETFIGALSSKVVKSEAHTLTVTFKFNNEDFLNNTIMWTPEHRDYERVPYRAPMGVDEDGKHKTVPVAGGHTLIGGHTGSGKGSILWNILGVLAGREDTMILGVDLKGGMEFKTNKDIFDSIAVEEEEFVQLVDFVHNITETRNRKYAGVERKLKPTAKVPMIVLIIDEAADIADIAKNKDYVGFETQLKQILRKGRAVNVVVIAALQDPNLGSFPMGRLFSTKIGLKLTSHQQSGFLGRESRAVFHLDKLTDGQRGVCIVQNENGGQSLIKAYFPDEPVIKSLPASVRK